MLRSAHSASDQMRFLTRFHHKPRKTTRPASDKKFSMENRCSAGEASNPASFFRQTLKLSTVEFLAVLSRAISGDFLIAISPRKSTVVLCLSRSSRASREKSFKLCLPLEPLQGDEEGDERSSSKTLGTSQELHDSRRNPT
jgi:hypothetical protein